MITIKSLRELLLKYCRLNENNIWIDPEGKHKVGCIDATDEEKVKDLLEGNSANLAIHDPPYNFVAFQERDTQNFVLWSKIWIQNSFKYP